ncbi:hypothetical protein SPRG_06089 [Saprolegnia parasitica CBS 223.65]|uniref:S1 motif domain-containing protein n=1 Tax=Saprolegnia parasitica (strain CBS 223.65) TaxID=695850 RepID=A0A067CE47_SAPPC|nr:hypothetical protein SPRG_06089 [Saprolegnia parasitica CBS 223.65]KDO29034.1 hypothetical protein SPRG_06089 [Saprolegnia parasitica CBS 223.65]|eukprot:XP_012200204.1 hypothetical protein SPRG_06089 [Saprolegnia parasitica CBS 223.65]
MDAEPKKKKRRCISKAERLAKRMQAVSLQEDEKLTQVEALCATDSSQDWDAAHRLATSLTTRAAFLAILLQKHQAKAAAHYTRRWDPPEDLSRLLGNDRVLAALHAHAATAATFLSAWRDAPVPPAALRKLLLAFVLPRIERKEDAPLQILLHQFAALKWRLLEHALVTTQGQHLVNQFAHVVRSLHDEPNIARPLTPWLEAVDGPIDIHLRESVRKLVEDVLQRVWPDARVHLFGSSVTGLCAEDSDVDLCVVVPSSPGRFADSVALAVDMHEHLSLYLPSPHSMVVKNARIPVIKTQLHGLDVDICVNNTAALWNSQLLVAFLRAYPALRPLCVCLRSWAARRSLLKSPTCAHSLSPYAFVLLILHWLQMRGYLPFVDVSFDDSLVVSIATIDDAIASALAEALPPPKTLATAAVPSLLVDFFIFYAADFAYGTDIASLRRRDLRKLKPSSTLQLEDPIEVDRNLGAYLNKLSQRTLRMEFVRACVLLHEALHPETYDAREAVGSLFFGHHARLPAPTASFLEVLIRPRASHHFGWNMAGDAIASEAFTTVVVTTRDAFPSLAGVDVVGVDCEGVNLGRSGSLALVSLAIGPTVYLVDVLSTPSLLDALKPLLESPSIVKVLHDCRKDSDALLHTAGISLTHVFDTQVAHAVLHQLRKPAAKDDGRHLVGPSGSAVIALDNANHECIAYADVLSHYLSLPPSRVKTSVKEAMTGDDATWTRRPFLPDLIEYAAMDVAYLSVLYRIMAHALGPHMPLCDARAAMYLGCRDWSFASTLNMGDMVPGYIQNITSKCVYVALSPSTVGRLSTSDAVKAPVGDDVQKLTVGAAITVKVGHDRSVQWTI